MKNQVFIFLFLFPLIGFSQGAARFGRTYSDTLPENFKLSTTKLREHIYQGIPEKIKNELYPRASYQFADQSAVQLSLFFSSGQLYSDWPALEKYVNYVLRKVMPKELQADTVIHAYMVKDGHLNAAMWPFGIITVNVGIFDDLPTEAALASILAHELAHYYLKHALNRYVKGKRGDFERIFNKTSSSGFSVENELQADSLGIVWMNNSGYGIHGIRDGYDALVRLEKRLVRRSPNKWELTESTHPSSKRRVAQVDSFVQKHPDMVGSDFLISVDKFYKFKELTKPEILKSLLYQFDFDACIEKAFKYHITDPNKGEYAYYLMEGIRRKCYFNSDLWKANFITDSYYEAVKTGISDQKARITDHVFKEIPRDMLCLTEEDVKAIQAKFYWEGEIKFKTNEEAFSFFYQVGKLLNEPECILSNALSLNFDPNARNTLLKKYLSSENIQYREYATALLNGAIQTNLPNKMLTVLSDLYVTVRQGSEEIYIRNEKLVDDNNLTPILESVVSDFSQRRYLNLSGIQGNRINDFAVFRELKILSLTPLYSKGEKTEVHILDPRFWQLMDKYKANDIEFIDLSYYDARKAESSLDAYKEVIQMNVNDLLSEVKRNRYLETRIASIREVPGGVMKLMHYGEEEKIPYNEPGKQVVIDYLIRHLKLKDKEASKKDLPLDAKKN
jgi:hypothetical protein